MIDLEVILIRGYERGVKRGGFHGTTKAEAGARVPKRWRYEWNITSNPQLLCPKRRCQQTVLCFAPWPTQKSLLSEKGVVGAFEVRLYYPEDDGL